MQYILSKEELDNLVPKQDKIKRDEALELARKRILELSKHACWHESSTDYRYCDNCPCLPSNAEQEEYEFKIGSRHDLFDKHRLICTLSKNFSK